ncbi:MAG: four helix bundle protein [Bacteroidetes bacterium]|nr:MAG: four helix bundle protein [Bacteroidota bacterium]
MEKKVIKSYKDLEIWKKGILLSMEIYSLTSTFPTDEKYGLTSQIRRATTSIPANIAEGYGRESGKNYIQFLKISRGSLYELDTFLTIALGLKYLTKEQRNNLNDKTEELSKMINSLIKKIDQNPK